MSNHLISLENVSLAFGLDILLDQVKLQIFKGERICLIGRNGAGKSSLLKIIEGVQLPDKGAVWRKPQLKLARLAQELPTTSELSIYEFVADGLAETGALLAAFHALTHHIASTHTADDLIKLERLQQAIEAKNGWQFDQHIQTILKRLELSPDQPLATLSGGWQRRAALAQALVSSPELLLLDEPTNHLDIETIQWLEDQLIGWGVGLVFVTHDRSLLKRLATRIIELDRGNLTSWPGDYTNFLRRKEEMLHAEEKQHAVFDKKLADEERWVRQGIKARRTRNEGRVRALYALRETRAKRREVQGKTSFQLNEAHKSGQLVIEAEHITHHFNNQCIIKDFSLRVMRGDRIALVGPNGVGKSTLLNILLGKLIPEQGQMKHGTQVKIAYFDQLRAALDLEKTVLDNVSDGTDIIETNGKKQHIMSYLSDFLFSPARSLTPVKALSGGECNRLLLARLFSRPANLLVLDEPTNDLDIETLELLEALLCQFQGTLLLVSHDRTFLDNVVTSTLVFEGQGKITEYMGGYEDWQHVHAKADAVTTTPTLKSETEKKRLPKLSYKQQQELTELPKRIEKLEKEQSELQKIISTPEFYQESQTVIAETMQRVEAIAADIAFTYERWEALEALSKKTSSE